MNKIIELENLNNKITDLDLEIKILSKDYYDKELERLRLLIEVSSLFRKYEILPNILHDEKSVLIDEMESTSHQEVDLKKELLDIAFEIDDLKIERGSLIRLFFEIKINLNDSRIIIE